MFKRLFLTSLLYSFVTLAYAEDEWTDHQEPLWSPSVGDSWTYQVSVEVAKNTTLPSGIPGQKIEELEKFNKMTIDRELKMIELKKENKELRNKLEKIKDKNSK